MDSIPSSIKDNAQLEREITELAAHIHAATYRLLCLILEFDERQVWSQWGMRSCAYWLNWQCGQLNIASAMDGLLYRDGRL